MTTMLIANYQTEQTMFQELLQPSSRKRILLFHGPSGSGKTTLIRACLQQVPESISYIPIALRGSGITIAEVLYRIGTEIGWKSLPRFLNEINILQGNGHLRDESPNQITSSNAINLALSVETGTPHEIRRVSALTRILFSDLRKLPNVLLVVFDSYEQATTKMADWISGPFLSHIAYASKVRVLLAGQVIPNPDNIEWGGFCTTFELSGVANSSNWLPIVQAMGRFIPVDDPESWLAGVCHALGGDPAMIMKIIESLPRMESVP